MMQHLPRITLLWLTLQSSLLAAGESLEIFPKTVVLDGKAATQGLLVCELNQSGPGKDLTRQARYRTCNDAVCIVDSQGRIVARGDGETEVEITFEGMSERVSVKVVNSAQIPRRYFQTDVVPILSRHGCNSSGCHGKAEGQNGFKLSVFGFDSFADFHAIVREGRGRRIFAASPSRSLLLTKATGAVPHGGGVRLSPGTAEYEVIHDWISAGAQMDEEFPQLDRLELHPNERVVDFEATQQLRVIAFFDNGASRDVTGLTRFRSNHEGLAQVDEQGLIRVGSAPGQVTVMATFLKKMATVQLLIPNPVSVAADSPVEKSLEEPTTHVVDRWVNHRLSQLNLTASRRADDSTFLRRVYLDVIGTLPTKSETVAFLKDQSKQKRMELVEQLLVRDEYTSYWSLKWSDTLRVDRQKLGYKDAFAYYKWIRDCFAENMPLDEFASAIVAAQGKLVEQPQGTFYKAVTESGERSSVLAQVFLGVRLECAQCHHHPFDRISQTDYHGMRAFFEPVKLVASSRGELIQSAGKAVVQHPRTGVDVPARALYEAPVSENESVRSQFAEWMTSPQNPWFARNIANRVWAHFMARGLVEPVDDLRPTNPPSNPELLDALAEHLIECDFDVKELIRLIVSSDAYQRGTSPNQSNERDEQNYSRAVFKRLDAEVLLDAICQVTDRPEKFAGNPMGIRAIELWDSGSKHYFLNLFGRPLRKSACQCERNVEANVSQILHVLNSKEMQKKITHPSGAVSRWATAVAQNGAVIEEMYLAFYSRYPTDEELDKAVVYCRKAESRKEALEDLAWSLMNSYEFLFNH
ncbi:MAG: DUF1553 domain-containing protein [Planctomycetaceae bacterium]|nr:DUF1553 domain-containing protein [Planctomycetaceae bacterium]